MAAITITITMGGLMVFDTAFFHVMPEVAEYYAVASVPTTSFGIRHYSFHGIANQPTLDVAATVSAVSRFA